jgi:hypothetical protein
VYRDRRIAAASEFTKQESSARLLLAVSGFRVGMRKPPDGLPLVCDTLSLAA